MQDLDQVAEQAPPLMSKTVYLMEQLKAAGEPITISINGRTGIVVEDEKSIDQLIVLVDRLETIKIVRDRLKAYDEGKRGLSLEELKEQVGRKHGFRFEFAEQAIAEILEILDWLAKRSPDQAEKWYQGLVDQINTLAKFPLRCPVSPDDKAFGEPVRELLYGKRPSTYRILFTIRENVVVILTIRHASRDSPES